MSKKNNNTNNLDGNNSVPPLIDGKVPMLALMDPRDYDDLKNNKAMDKNGIRHKEGNYWSRQPEHRDLPPEMCDALRRQQNDTGRTAGVPAQASPRLPASRTSGNIPTFYRRSSAQSGMDVKKVIGGFMVQCVFKPTLVRVTQKYVVPCLTDKLGVLFCRLTGWNGSTFDPRMLEYVEDAEYYDDPAEEDDILTDTEPSAETEETAREKPVHSDNIVEFPA